MLRIRSKNVSKIALGSSCGSVVHTVTERENKRNQKIPGLLPSPGKLKKKTKISLLCSLLGIFFA
jgi:hypothetical protein